tara:strand:+ start:1601 stop:1735 length:135 start_codon:yes stop_codon:yes gene_type:complete
MIEVEIIEGEEDRVGMRAAGCLWIVVCKVEQLSLYCRLIERQLL